MNDCNNLHRLDCRPFIVAQRRPLITDRSFLPRTVVIAALITSCCVPKQPLENSPISIWQQQQKRTVGDDIVFHQPYNTYVATVVVLLPETRVGYCFR